MSKYKLKLYILGETVLAKRAIKNLEIICESPELQDQYEMEVINLLDHPTLAESEKIIATPVLIKSLPSPMRRIIGDLSDHQKVLVGLDLHEL
ncbi:MAG: circadian clock KaiB family protein [Legionellaceae bacterium]|nr:circadian clock KaiB family protein [Legionellaceae bacterium]